MQLALRPYVTTGVAIVGASVIAVAPIVPTPTEIQIPNPITQVERGVQLTAGQIENAFNQVAFVGAQVLFRVATLPAPVVARILGVSEPEAALLLGVTTLGLTGSLISGTGATGAALQDIVDQLGNGDLIGLLNSLIGAPATLIDGVVNGGYGPDLSSLFASLLSPTAKEAIFPVLAGGLIFGKNFPFGSLSLDPLQLVLPGLFPTLQGLVTLLANKLGLGGASTMAAPLAAPVESGGQIEDGVNALLFNLVASPIVTISGFLGSLLAPIIGQEQATLLPIAALGLLGPLISGPGAIGTATQDVVNSLGKGDFAGVINSLIGAPATVIDGFINGGYGPDLASLVIPLIAPDTPPALFPVVRAGGLINEQVVQGIPIPVPPFFLPTNIKLPGTIPTIQKLVSQILGLLPGASALSTVTPFAASAPVEPLSINSVDTGTSDKKLVTLNVAPNTDDQGDQGGKKKPDAALSALDKTLPDTAKAPDVKGAIEGSDPGPGRGKDVSEAAKPDQAHGGALAKTDTETVDTSDGNKVIPETAVSDDDNGGGNKKGGGSNPVGSAISSVAKNLAGAVRGALGG